MYILIAILISVIIGMLLGLVPFFIGKAQNKPELGKLGFICCTVSGLIGISFLVCVGFSIAVIVCREDYSVGGNATSANTWSITWLSGPFKGQTQAIGPGGHILGRDVSCTIQFPNTCSDVSHAHCRIYWDNGKLMIEDLNSTFGTYSVDGRRLLQYQPAPVQDAGQYYLTNHGYCFEFRKF